MKTIEVKYLGVDDWHRAVYITNDGTILKNIELSSIPTQSNLSTVNRNCFNGEPDIPLIYNRQELSFIVVEHFTK